jgi:capsular polysaccharide biosynthesis protein
MANYWVIDALRNQKGFLFFVGVIFSIVGFIVLLFSGAHYEVRTDFLVSQEEIGAKDYYTLARSSEYIGKILGEVIYSERFIAALIDTGKVNSEFLPFDKKARLEKWQDMVKIKRELDLGIIQVTVASDTVRDAQKVSQAVAQVLIDKNGLFLGTNDKNIPISILSGPIAERNPSLKEMISVIIGGFVFGILSALLGIFLKYEALRPKDMPVEPKY